jgi:hypothetical protein
VLPVYLRSSVLYILRGEDGMCGSGETVYRFRNIALTLVQWRTI